jgi:SPP1 gp7 family putative phage head morphogenesis protein
MDTIMVASPLRSDLRPPSDPRALRRWLTRKEDRLAQILGDELTTLVRRSVNAFAETLPSLTASGDFAVFDQIPFEWLGIIDSRLLPELEAIYLAGGVNVWAAAPAGAIPPQAAQAWASVVNENAREYLTRRRNLLVGVGENLFQGVIAQVDRAILTGASAEEVKQSLEQLGNFSEFRADTIARTEINNAYVNGNWEASQAMGEYGPVEKMWLATFDARTRPSHADANGVLLPWSEPFIVDGEEMQYPHDPNASAANSVNCRCILLEFWPGDIRPDGSVVGEDMIDRVDPEMLRPLDYEGEEI